VFAASSNSKFHFRLTLLFDAHVTLVFLLYVSKRRGLRYQGCLPRTSWWLWRMIEYSMHAHTYNRVHSIYRRCDYRVIALWIHNRCVKEERNRSSAHPRALQQHSIRRSETIPKHWPTSDVALAPILRTSTSRNLRFLYSGNGYVQKTKPLNKRSIIL